MTSRSLGRLLALFLSTSLVSLQGADNVPARVALHGHVPKVIEQLKPLGILPGTTNLSLAIGLPLSNQAELDELLQQLQDPASPNYHKYLTTQEFTARFGPSEAQYESVIQFARRYGLAVTGTHPNRLVLDVTGSVTNIERAFHVNIRTYQHPTESRKFFAPDVEPSVPTDLPVTDMWGLSDYGRPTPLVRFSSAPTNSPRNYNGSGPGGAYQGADYRNAYAPSTALRGANQIAAVAEFDGYYASDISAYESGSGYTNVPLQNVLIDFVSGNPGYSGVQNAVAEVSLDIELIIAMAPSLTKLIVYEGNNPYDVFNRIVTDNSAKQISCSWAWGVGPGFNWGTRHNPKTLDSQFQQMAAQGQSFFEASGDSDAYTGSGAMTSSSGPVPQDSVYLTCVGGTSLTMNGAGGSYISETVWNWGGNTGSSGGVSSNYSIPTWQASVDMSSNNGSTTLRNIPDVALTADAVNVRYNNGAQGTFGGTSCAAPLWAGFTALANQQAAAAGKPPVGFLNPALYAIGMSTNYTACFHDITVGNNIGANTPGLYNAVPGYDLCTGWGTPNGTNLINALSPYPAILLSPVSQSVINGTIVNLSVIASGQAPLTYTWRLNGTNLPPGPNISGLGGNVLTFSPVTGSNGGNYSVVVANASGSITSSVAALTVTAPPVFATQPAGTGVVAGSSALLSASVSGATPLTYRWKLNGANVSNAVNISGATSNVLAISPVAVSNAGNYTLVATNVFGAATSSVAALTVFLPAFISVPPVARTVECSSNASFSVTATGTPPLSYLWKVDGLTVPGATSSSITFTNVHLPNHTVSVVVTNFYGIASNSAALTVHDTLPPMMTLMGSNPVYVELGGVFTDPGATAFDLCAGPVPAVPSGAVNVSAVGTNFVMYTADDGNGNTNTIGRTVIVRDTTPPAIVWSFTNLVGAAGTNCAAAIPDLTGTNYITTTDLSGPPTVSQSPATNSLLPIGTNVVVLTAADTSGNKSFSTNYFIVIDQTPPLILNQPLSQTNLVSSTAVFSITASACTTLTYQWFFNDSALDSQTNSSLTISNLAPAATGNYFVVAGSSGGSTTSVVATLTVELLPTTIALASSRSPSGFKDAINFTAAVASSNATGTIQFVANNSALDMQPVVDGQAASTNTSALPRGTNLIAAIYSGDVFDLPCTNSFAQIVTNHPPSAVPAYFNRSPGVPLVIPITNLASNWSDVDGDTVTLASVSQSTNGVTVTNTGDSLLYFNTSNVSDQFFCSVTDGWGGTNLQTVTVSILLPTITGVAANQDGTITLKFSGAPDTPVVLETTVDLASPIWLPLATNNLDASGLWQFTDTAATNSSQGFYRLRIAP